MGVDARPVSPEGIPQNCPAFAELCIQALNLQPIQISDDTGLFPFADCEELNPDMGHGRIVRKFIRVSDPVWNFH